jgi:hypothetical protein
MPLDDFVPITRKLFLTIAKDIINGDRINPINSTIVPKTDTGIPTTVIADNTITITVKIINRNPTTVFFMTDFFKFDRTVSN